MTSQSPDTEGELGGHEHAPVEHGPLADRFAFLCDAVAGTEGAEAEVDLAVALVSGAVAALRRLHGQGPAEGVSPSSLMGNYAALGFASRYTIRNVDTGDRSAVRSIVEGNRDVERSVGEARDSLRLAGKEIFEILQTLGTVLDRLRQLGGHVVDAVDASRNAVGGLTILSETTQYVDVALTHPDLVE